ncbi:MAG: hypothetical protein NVSMB63_10560 [Sediminibacterium sp.]
MKRIKFSKTNTATFIAILFHLSGLIGILCTPYKNWFISHTPLNLLIMVFLLLWCQPQRNSSFFLFLLVAFVAGIGTEMIGVHTGRLFGSYVYGTVMGPRLNGVPWIIGLNWFVVVFCSGSIMSQVHNWFREKYEEGGMQMSAGMQAFSLVIDGALLAVFFDWIMEPVAMRLHFWQWVQGEVPLFNYGCWLGISTVLLILFRYLPFNKANHFAVHLFIIQVLFFLTLRTYL